MSVKMHVPLQVEKINWVYGTIRFTDPVVFKFVVYGLDWSSVAYVTKWMYNYK